MISKTDFAYAAGYIDGDGCFFLGIHNCIAEKRIRRRCAIYISSTSHLNVCWFQSKFGGVVKATKQRKNNHKIIYRYELKGPFIENILGIYSFLQEKKDEYDLFEKFRKRTSIDVCPNLVIAIRNLKNNGFLIDKSIKNELDLIRNTIQPSEEDFAYLAGFIDAECCLGIQRNKPKNERSNPTFKIQLQCNNSKYPFFYWVSKRFGGQFHFIERKQKYNQRNQMTWRLSSKALFSIIEKIYPFLKQKKEVCGELIKFYKTTLKEKKIGPNNPAFAEYYRPILETREEIFHKVKQLNKKGFSLSG